MSASMSAQELLLRQRTQILHALCSSGSAEHLDQVLDILLSRGELAPEDYQSIQVPGRALYTNGRRLLDLLHAKGVDACALFYAALKQVLPGGQGAACSFPGFCSSGGEKEGNYPSTCAQALLTQRPSLVSELQGRVEDALHSLVITGHFSSADCNDVRLPIYTPSQQARRLLDHVRSKGESAAEVVLCYVQQKRGSGSSLDQENWTPPKVVLKYQKKLSSSVSAQSCFLSTYGGTSHMHLDDIYTEGQLELAQYCDDVHGPLGLEDVVGAVGTVNREADTVLVSGDAGGGKSTLLQRLHLLWARGTLLREFLLLFPFSCRRLNSEQQELSVKELLFERCCWPDRQREEIFQFILDHPHLILFTFDGLDELKQGFSDERRLCCPTQRAPVHILLFNLIQGSLMKGVRKVVTSRPEAVGPALKKHLCKEVLLQGFTPGGIDSFVRKHHRDPAVASKVLESLRTKNALLGLCHSPVLCWIVSHCHKELLGGGEGSPQTITDVYLMILQHFFQHRSSPKSNAGTSWLREHLDTVLHLGQLAFEGIGTSCFIFSGAALDKCGVTEKDICMGFLVQSRDMSRTHSKNVEFLHLMMQCFFAALYIVLSNNADRSVISNLFEPQNTRDTALGTTSCFGVCSSSTEKPRQALQGEAATAETSNLKITATFVSGLLSQRHRSLWLHGCPSAVTEKRVRQVVRCLSKGMHKHFKSIPPPVGGEKKSMHAMPGFVWLIKCIYEMQDSRVAKDALSRLEVDHLKLTYCHIGPVECTALAYVLQHLRNPVGLQLDNNSVGDVGVEQLLPCMHNCNSLYLRNNNITDEGIRKLLATGIHCDSFRKIALGNNNITEEGAKQLAEGLKSNRSLKYLGLWGNKIGDAGAVALASALQSSTSLVWLSLVGNGVGDAGAGALANIIRNSTSLEELWLTENCITRTGVECLIQALENNTLMKSVWLINNDLTLEEVEELTQRESRLTF
ncbi:nucleotide-binding oligomerization domain-containing protein 2 isoform 2-T2 [Spinachia spinachia]